jgi:hypothetical protein
MTVVVGDEVIGDISLAVGSAVLVGGTVTISRKSGTGVGTNGSGVGPRPQVIG